MSMRQKRVAEQIREAVSGSISKGGFNDPLIDNMINIPYVWISPDLRNARVYFTSLNTLDDKALKAIKQALNTEAFRFQQDIASFNRKNTPKLKFYLDDDKDRTTRIEDLLHKTKTSEEMA